MPNYIASASFFSREKNRRYEANDLVEDLPVAYYERYRLSHPGLLRPAPMNTMGMPMQIRAEVPAVAAETPAIAPPTPDAAPAREQDEAAPVETTTPGETPASVATVPADAPADTTVTAEDGDAKPKAKPRAKKA